MNHDDFENISCIRCKVAYPGHRRTCLCCNEYNPFYLADPEDDFYNNDEFSDEDFNLFITKIIKFDPLA